MVSDYATTTIATTTIGEFLGQEFRVCVREWEHALFTLQEVRVRDRTSGTDFEHYTSYDEAYAEGVRLAHAAIAGH